MKQIFKISDKTIKTQKKRGIFLSASVPITLFLTFLYMKGNSDNLLYEVIIPFIFALIMIELICYFTIKKAITNSKEMTVAITDSYIERKSGTFTDKILFTDISNYKVKKDRDDKVTMLTITAQKTCIVLSGYENMDEIYSKVNQISINTRKLQNNNRSIDWIDPINIILAIIYFSLALVSIFRLGGKAYVVIDYFIPLTIGIYVYIFKPITKHSGVRYKKYEIVFSLILFVLNAVLIVEKLFF